MSAIRVLFQTCFEEGGTLLQAMAASTRREPGCLQAEFFRSVECPENQLYLELWESPAAWDLHWAHTRPVAEKSKVVDLWRSNEAPFHNGSTQSPRRIGRNGIEFYKLARFALVNSTWIATNENERAQTIRWPAWEQVRILIQMTADPALTAESWIKNSLETRAEQGCLEFEYFRSVDYPENIALVEAWSTPEIYDIHWMRRIVQQPAKPRPPFQRRYGESGFEWYGHCWYTLNGNNIWEPEAPERRMSTVFW